MAEQSSSIMTEAEVCARTRLHRVTIYHLRRRGDFPLPLKLGRRKLGWLEHEVDAWIAARAAERRVA
jgi:prophage regulatory protein